MKIIEGVNDKERVSWAFLTSGAVASIGAILGYEGLCTKYWWIFAVVIFCGGLLNFVLTLKDDNFYMS